MSMDNYVISINMPIKEEDLISGIKSLSPIPKAPKKKVVEEKEPLMLSSIGKKKEKEKKKKKEKGLDAQFLGSRELDDDQDDEINTIMEEDNLIDIDELLNRDDDDFIDEGIIDEQRRGYDKLKQQENPYKKEFAEELTLLYALLKELNEFSKDLEKKYRGMESSKVRGMSKYTNEIINSIISAKSSKLSVLKEISSVKKSIADLKLKADAKSKSEAGPNSMEHMASTYFQQALKYGRNRLVKEMGGGNHADDVDDMVEEIEQRKSGYSPLDLEDIERAIEERLESEDNSFRSSAGSKYIEYENLGVKIFVVRYVDTGDWEFIALDRDQQRVDDYPLPNRRLVKKMKFSDDGRNATDDRGRSYRVIEQYTTE